MDLKTGDIYQGDMAEVSKKLGHAEIVPIDPVKLTRAQRRRRRVSLHDRRSYAGMLLTRERRERGLSWSALSWNQKRNLRKRLKIGRAT